MSDEKPREFSLKGNRLFETTNGRWAHILEALHPTEIKLIEKSAYDAVVKDAQEDYVASVKEKNQLRAEVEHEKEMRTLIEVNRDQLRKDKARLETELTVEKLASGTCADAYTNLTAAYSVLEDAMKCKCVCYDAGDPRASRNPCHACAALAQAEKLRGGE
jgi:hypothetical protein